ncbi:hypothetical protein GXP71_01910 [Cellulomonas sp. H30R-01]|uniref:hypothetical protein n=1 Tax=Cellulomonas sp. H30R-01 TaxID=2704467 RepID=UPI00138D7EAE|nr:hypothetical protein [Cellulomonas sp. H30R-01]QHT54966.1 hypothetical protein GXP71_01910 [Cellulomonas sp. H30R-01]
MTGTGPSESPWGAAPVGHGASRTDAHRPPWAPEDWHAGLVRGPARVALLCALCWTVLLGVTLVSGVVATALTAWRTAAGGGGADVASASASLVLVPFVALTAIVPVAVVGWPVGLLTAWLLRRRPREAEHVLAFAAVGAVLAVGLLPSWASGAWPAAGAAGALVALVGAGGAGGGRWWAGAVLRRRAARGELAARPGIAPPTSW